MYLPEKGKAPQLNKAVLEVVKPSSERELVESRSLKRTARWSFRRQGL